MVQLDKTPSRDRAQDFLRSRKIVWLATMHAAGRPHIVAVWYIWDQDAAYIVSRPDAQKVQNLRKNPNCSLAVDDSENGHQPVAMDGVASLDPGPLPEPARDRYVEKYDKMLAAMSWTHQQYFALYSQVIRFTPTKFLKVT